jgi:hypothetical protein
LVAYSDIGAARAAISPGPLAVGDLQSSAYNYAFVAVFLFLGTAGVLRLGLFWRGEYAKRLDDAFAPLGKITSRAACATVPFVFPLAFVIGLLYLTLILKGRFGGGLGGALEFLANVLTVVFTVLMVVLFSVILFNRPHLVVPPHRRNSHGLIGDAARALLAWMRR